MFGLCCHYLVESERPGIYVNLLKQRTLQLGRFRDGKYSNECIRQVWLDNLNTLITNLPYIFKTYKVFRFPSGILPLWDQMPEECYTKDHEILSLFARIGCEVIRHDVRATFHPGQFCSLSSDRPEVREAAVRELNHHAWQFDAMGLAQNPYYAINIHGGKRDRAKTLVRTITATDDTQMHHRLTPGARNRLTLENDEMCYNVPDLLEVFQETNVPIVFDSHHHTFNTGGIDIALASAASKATWGKIKPLQHVSNSIPTVSVDASIQKRRAHSDYIRHIPEPQFSDIRADTIDLDVEAKMKNLAIDNVNPHLAGHSA